MRYYKRNINHMAYTKANGKATAKYDKEHYKKATVKITLEIFAKMQKCKGFKNMNQFLNMLILEGIEKEDWKQ